MRSNLLSELMTMHTYCRPAGSVAEQAFIARYVACLPDAYRDLHGNYHVEVGKNPTVVFSCHTDTVHWTSGHQRVSLSTDGILSVITLQKHADRRHSQWTGNLRHGGQVIPFRRPDCLGADDTVGVFLCRQMVLAGVPGHYIFHYGEEKGCLGSRDLAKHSPDLLKGVTQAIAFDRAGVTDVITHQMGLRCCSDDYALELAIALGGDYLPCDRGVYTDTNEYTDLVPECTNLSVGYAHQHSERETVDITHVDRLLRRLLMIDWASLPIVRDPQAWSDDGYEWGSWRESSDVATGSVTVLDSSDPCAYLDSWECLICSRMNRSYLDVCLTCGEDREESDSQRAFLVRMQARQLASGCQCKYAVYGGHDADCPLSLCPRSYDATVCGCTPITQHGVTYHSKDCPEYVPCVDNRLMD